MMYVIMHTTKNEPVDFHVKTRSSKKGFNYRLVMQMEKHKG